MGTDAISLHATHCHRLQSGDQAAPVSADPRETPRHRPGTLDGAIHEADDVLDIRTRGGVLLAELRHHAAQHQRTSGQILSEAVMEVRSDAQLFASGDLEDLAL